MRLQVTDIPHDHDPDRDRDRDDVDQPNQSDDRWLRSPLRRLLSLSVHPQALIRRGRRHRRHSRKPNTK
jgi:hypothetical protein